MSPALDAAKEVLVEGGYATRVFELATEAAGARPVLAFEDQTVIGFVLEYDAPGDLIAQWKTDGLRVAARQRVALVAAAQKAWNTYLVLLTGPGASFNEALLLGQIEEDLEGMRKIARAGVADAAHARKALLPLLPLLARPTLEPVDMVSEIRSRASELDAAVVDIFLSRAEEGVMLQVLEANQ